MKNFFLKFKSLLVGLFILIFIQFACNFVIRGLHLTFPAPLLGMLVLAVLLYLKVIPASIIEDICKLLLDNMSLFFIPLFVGIISYVHLLKTNLVAISVVIITTTFLTMVLTALFVDLIIKVTKRGQSDD